MSALLLPLFGLLASVSGHGGVLWPPTWQAGGHNTRADQGLRRVHHTQGRGPQHQALDHVGQELELSAGLREV